MSLQSCDAARERSDGARVQLGDIARAHGAALRDSYALSPDQHAVLAAIARCRTAALGGHQHVCERCGHSVVMYNSCRNRHCPNCQNIEQHHWIEQRQKRILPVRYFHVVFTLPEALRPWVRANRAVMFAMLFHASADTLLTLAKDPKWLGAMPAITMVLHTWTRELLFHPHVHAIVSAGGLSPDRTRWIASRRNGRFLFPVKILGTLFRAKFRDAMLVAFASGALSVPNDLPNDALDRLRGAFSLKHWNVYAKPPFGGVEQVYSYLGRYTHRVGISNARLRTMDERGVTFVTKAGRTVSVPGVEFLRRFIDHVLPHGFTKIRHYGLLAPCHATTTLEHSRALIAPAARSAPGDTAATSTSEDSIPQSWNDCLFALTGIDALQCPRCHDGRLIRLPLLDPSAVTRRDSS